MHICKQKLLFWMRLITINCLTALEKMHCCSAPPSVQAWISRRRSIVSHSVWKQRSSAIRLAFSHRTQCETAFKSSIMQKKKSFNRTILTYIMFVLLSVSHINYSDCEIRRPSVYASDCQWKYPFIGIHFIPFGYRVTASSQFRKGAPGCRCRTLEHPSQRWQWFDRTPCKYLLDLPYLLAVPKYVTLGLWWWQIFYHRGGNGPTTAGGAVLCIFIYIILKRKNK